ncbi:MAG: NAD-dependent epimerase/dehydratase family protein [Nitrolancea sp.]
MRVLVIGGTQFIGPYVVRRLSRDGHEVAVFHRGQTEAKLPRDVRHIHGDRADMAQFVDTFRDFAPEVVIDMRALTESDVCHTVDAVRGIARRIVAISSMDVYHAYGILTGFEEGPVQPMPLTEDSPVRSKLYLYRGTQNSRLPDVDNYDKIMVERVVLGNDDLPGTVLRLPVVYGPGDGQHRLWPYLKRMDDGRATILLGERAAKRRFARSFVDNVAAAIVRTVTDERAAGRIYNVSEPESLAEADWIAQVAKQVGWTGQVVTLPDEEMPEHLRESGAIEQEMVADSTRIRHELGFREEVGREEALDQTIAWERQSPPPEDPARFDYAAEDAVLAER